MAGDSDEDTGPIALVRPPPIGVNRDGVEYGVMSIPRGVQFWIGNQGFTLAHTDLDPDDPDSEVCRDHAIRMITIALKRLAGS